MRTDVTADAVLIVTEVGVEDALDTMTPALSSFAIHTGVFVHVFAKLTVIADTELPVTTRIVRSSPTTEEQPVPQVGAGPPVIRWPR